MTTQFSRSLKAGVFTFILIVSMFFSGSFAVHAAPSVMSTEQQLALIQQLLAQIQMLQKQLAAMQSGGNIAQSTKAYTLQSLFFKNDATAKKIITGDSTTVSIRDFPLLAARSETRTNSFAYRVVNALRMLGYAEGENTEMYVGEEYLYPFKRKNNLPVTPIIDAVTLQKIDAQLAVREVQDARNAKNFPLYSYMIKPPENEPSKEHAAALFGIAFQSLPKHLVVWDRENFVDFLTNQMSSLNKDLKIQKGGGEIDYSTYKLCFALLYPTLVDSFEERERCVWKDKIHGFWGSDFAIASTLIHEYAHFLDKNIFGSYQKVSRGTVDTTGFYAISYDLNTENIDPTTQWKRYDVRKQTQDKSGEFVSSYAIGWGGASPTTGKELRTPYEDFAESFTMYVLQGQIFRELSKSSPTIAQKYAWLKKNVFKGTEYMTGDVSSLAMLKNRPRSEENILAFNVIDYSVFIPDFAWDYAIKVK